MTWVCLDISCLCSNSQQLPKPLFLQILASFCDDETNVLTKFVDGVKKNSMPWSPLPFAIFFNNSQISCWCRKKCFLFFIFPAALERTSLSCPFSEPLSLSSSWPKPFYWSWWRHDQPYTQGVQNIRVPIVLLTR